MPTVGGGTIPSEITQTVRFFNTTGVIDRQHNVYLSPRFERVNGTFKVNEKFISLLDTETDPPLEYTSIDISKWSPQDRTLVVRGNIDDFRHKELSEAYRYGLNYCIVTRHVTVNSVTNTYYYAFFITDAEQSGGASVRLTLDPDHFTNVFYLSNNTTLSTATQKANFDPFNAVMKNCFIDRQHYNRIKMIGMLTCLIKPASSISVNVGDNITLSYNVYGNYVDISGTVETYNWSQQGTTNYLEVVLKDWTGDYQAVGHPENWSEYVNNTTQESADFDYDATPHFQAISYPDNIKIFLNQEEGFSYKYQYRDVKYPLSDLSNNPKNFSDTEMETINQTSDFSNLSNALKQKIIRACLGFLVVETKSMEKIGRINNITGGIDKFAYDYTGGNLYNGIITPNIRVAFPTFIYPEQFKKYKSAIHRYGCWLSARYNSSITLTTILDYGADYLQKIGKTGMSDFIYSMYVVKNLGLRNDNVTIDISQEKIYFNVRIPYTNPIGQTQIINNAYFGEGLRVAPLANKTTTSSDGGLMILWDTNTELPIAISVTNSDEFSLGLVYCYDSDNSYQNIEIKLEDSLRYKNLKTEYADPVLETEPYSFWSISTYGNYELVFNKNRFAKDDFIYLINLKYYLSINGALKIGIIPSYTVEDKETNYFNEGLVFTVASSLPMSSDSYDSFYYQNKAQMKNQYAVADREGITSIIKGVDKLGTQVVSQTTGGVSSLGLGGSAGAGGIASTAIKAGNAVANNLIDAENSAISWNTQRYNIKTTQRAKLADVGASPDTFKQAGSDIIYDLSTVELSLFVNHYTIDSLSYNSICKYLERYGYQVGLYDTLHTKDRVGWNYIKTISFDIYNPVINLEQEARIREVFNAGVTLLHNSSFLTSGHNYETILE